MTTAPAALSVRQITRRYGALTALDDVSFDVAPACVHALLGANGSGKSTLIRIVAGVERGSRAGSVSVAGRTVDAHRISPGWSRRAGVRVVHQGTTGFPDLSVAENVALGTTYPTKGPAIAWPTLQRRTTELLADFGLEVDPSSPLATLSPSTQTLVLVARALADAAGRPASEHGARRLVVLDEPTAALPADEVQSLLRGLRSLADSGHSVLLVTHRLDEVRRVADDVTVLRDGHRVATFALASEPPERIVEMICGTTPNEVERKPSPSAPGPAVLSVRSMSVGPVEGLSFEVPAGEIVGLAGLLGSGRSGVLGAVFGSRARAGTVQVDGTDLPPADPVAAMAAGVALVPERRDLAVFDDLSVAENLSVASLSQLRRWARLDGRAERDLARDDTTTYGIRAGDVRQPITHLSGGNQQKVVIARWLRRRPRLLLLDEPTAGVDVGARVDLHRLVRRCVDAGAAAVLVTSDAEEMCELAHRVLVLHGGRLVVVLSADELTADELERRVHLAVAR